MYLAFCEYCNQMTNHKDGKCLKHKQPGYNPADHFTVEGWDELGKLIAKGDQ